MATWSQVRRLATGLPDVVEEGDEHPRWRVKGKAFAWDRPLRRSDLQHLGDAAPTGEVLATYVDDLVAKDALLATEGPVVFTTPHFDAYPIVLVRLDDVPRDLLEELVVGAWLARAPDRLVRAYLAERPGV